MIYSCGIQISENPAQQSATNFDGGKSTSCHQSACLHFSLIEFDSLRVGMKASERAKLTQAKDERHERVHGGVTDVLVEASV